MIKPINAEVMEGTILVQHAEAPVAIRKFIVEKAKNHWKELKDVNTNHVLGLAKAKSDLLDTKFSEHITQNLGW